MNYGKDHPLVDSHAHINMSDFDTDRDEVISRAFEKGIQAIHCPAELTDPDRLDVAIRMGKEYPGITLSAGVHPHAADEFLPGHIRTLSSLAAQNTILAVGEIGLDFHYDFSSREKQMDTFRLQLNAAEENKLPVIIHSRLAGKQIHRLTMEENFSRGGVLHCFTEDWDFAEKMMEKGFYISFSGILTFPNARDLRDIAKRVPLDRLMVETDSPYLTPMPFRGRIKRNEPVYVRYTMETLAAVKGVDSPEMADITSENFRRCFQLK